MENHRTCESQSILLTRRVGRLKEPMQTRVKFYLNKLRAGKRDGDILTQDDLDRSMGRALQDMQDDQAVRFDRAEIAAAMSGIEAGKTVCLEEIVDGLPS